MPLLFYFHTFCYKSCQKYCKEDSLEKHILLIRLFNLFRYSTLPVGVEDDQFCNTTFRYHLSHSDVLLFSVFVRRRALSVNNLIFITS